jgi:hypothetical protein
VGDQQGFIPHATSPTGELDDQVVARYKAEKDASDTTAVAATGLPPLLPATAGAGGKVQEAEVGLSLCGGQPFPWQCSTITKQTTQCSNSDSIESLLLHSDSILSKLLCNACILDTSNMLKRDQPAHNIMSYIDNSILACNAF